MNKKLDKKDHVSFETAKLLREAGYPQDNLTSWYSAKKDFLCKKDNYMPIMGQDLAAPHLWDAMKWLRNRKQIYVHPYHEIWWSHIWRCWVDYPNGKRCSINGVPFHTDGFVEPYDSGFPTYEQACDQGIKAVCEWLIEQKGGES